MFVQRIPLYLCTSVHAVLKFNNSCSRQDVDFKRLVKTYVNVKVRVKVNVHSPYNRPRRTRGGAVV